jgi:hypothetical protein
MPAHQVGSYVPLVTRNDHPEAAQGAEPAAGHRHPHYEIRVRGHLPQRWAAWFEGMDLRTTDDGTTVIAGAVADQAALHGVLQKLRDLGIALISLTEVSDTTTEGPAPRPTEGN